MTLTPKQADIIKSLATSDDGMTPTEIGHACGKTHGRASSWAHTTLKSLVKQRLVSKRLRDGNVVYGLTANGKAWAKDLMS